MALSGLPSCWPLSWPPTIHPIPFRFVFPFAQVSFHCWSGRPGRWLASSLPSVAPSPTLPFWIAFSGANGGKGGPLVDAVVIIIHSPTWGEIRTSRLAAITQAAFLACLAGTFANSTVSPSAGVGCVKMASLSVVYGKLPSIAL
jgi:hypothetical protein